MQRVEGGGVRKGVESRYRRKSCNAYDKYKNCGAGKKFTWRVWKDSQGKLMRVSHSDKEIMNAKLWGSIRPLVCTGDLISSAGKE